MAKLSFYDILLSLKELPLCSCPHPIGKSFFFFSGRKVKKRAGEKKPSDTGKVRDR